MGQSVNHFLIRAFEERAQRSLEGRTREPDTTHCGTEVKSVLSTSNVQQEAQETISIGQRLIEVKDRDVHHYSVAIAVMSCQYPGQLFEVTSGFVIIVPGTRAPMIENAIASR
jgi:orotidine-5'-phosphate decarboxylase